MQDCNNCSASSMELLQSYAKPSNLPVYTRPDSKAFYRAGNRGLKTYIYNMSNKSNV